MDYEALWDEKYAPVYGALAPHYHRFLSELLGVTAPTEPVPAAAEPIASAPSTEDAGPATAGVDANGSPV